VAGGARTDDQGNHAGAIAAGGLKPLDQLLHLPYLNLSSILSVTIAGQSHGCALLTFFSASLALGSLMVKN
jgi:hypothetical protein